MTKVKYAPMRLGDAHKRDVRTQFGALCWRTHKGERQILLVTSRRSGRWIIPKGWPVDGVSAAEAAAQEAWEEAGVEGRVKNVCLGIYSYSKLLEKNVALPCVVAVFPMKVKRMRDTWPEAKDRRRKWFTQRKASNLVDAPELRRILRDFDPKGLPD